MALIEFENDDKYFIKFFLLDATLNLNKWGVTERALKAHLNSFIDKPFVLTPDFDHPKAANGDDLLVQQEAYRVGNIIQVGIEQRSGKAWGLAEITNPEAAEILKRGDVNFVSPSIVFDNLSEEYRDGNSIITSFTAAHVAAVKDPAYGVDKAEIKGKCAGGSQTCLAQLSRVQASRSKCGRFTTIKAGKKEFIIAANECVERCIKKKVEGGKAINEQALAICYSECGESTKIEEDNTSTDVSEEGNISQESLDNITEEELLKKKTVGVTEDEYKKDTSHKPKKITKANDMKRNLYAEEKDEDEKHEAEDSDKLDLTDRQKEFLEDKKSKKSKKSRKAEDEEERHEREMSKAEDDDKKEEEAEEEEDDKKEASLRSQVRSLKSELKALKAKVKSAEIDPLIDQILEAKSQLGKIDERVEYAKLSKLDIGTLHELADNYKGIVQARTEHPRFTVRQASVDSSLKGDSIFKKISGGYD
jgi:hypothetical protein|tara:strand:- start:3496 stop:4923 length:1428 start_codon:yes stop_codon:yes gene_type:complete